MTTDSARASAILSFADEVGLDRQQLQRAPTVDRLIQSASRTLDAEPPVRTFKDLEAVFEGGLDPQARRRSGAVYTPTFIVDELVRSVFAMRGRGIDTFLDPACGAGGFLLGAASQLSAAGGNPQKLVEEVLLGIDHDSVAVENSHVMLELWLLLNGANPNCDKRLLCVDSLTTPTAQLLEKLDAKTGVSAIATNPPYVKLQTLETLYRSQLLEMFSGLAQGSFSLSLLFTVRSHDLLDEHGVAGFITQNNFFTSLAGVEVRRYVQERRILRRICNFGHAKVFDGASAYTCLLYVGSEKSDAVEFATVRKPSAVSLASASYSPIETADLNPKKWRLAEEPHLTNLRRIEAMPLSLKSIATIRVGFATLKDSVFLLRIDPSEGGPVAGGVAIEPEICRPCVKVAELREREAVSTPTRAVIFPYELQGRSFVLVPESELAERYPLAYRYLLDHRKELATREKGRPIEEGWYAWGRRQGFTSSGPKLLTKTFDARPTFPLDPSDALFCNGYSVTLRSDLPIASATDFDITDLQRVLNSDLMEYYARLTSFQITGNYQCYQKNFIEPFGLPEPSDRLVAITRSTDSFQERLCSLYGIDYNDVWRFLEAERSA